MNRAGPELDKRFLVVGEPIGPVALFRVFYVDKVQSSIPNEQIDGFFNDVNGYSGDLPQLADDLSLVIVDALGVRSTFQAAVEDVAVSEKSTTMSP